MLAALALAIDMFDIISSSGRVDKLAKREAGAGVEQSACGSLVMRACQRARVERGVGACCPPSLETTSCKCVRLPRQPQHGLSVYLSRHAVADLREACH